MMERPAQIVATRTSQHIYLQHILFYGSHILLLILGECGQLLINDNEPPTDLSPESGSPSLPKRQGLRLQPSALGTSSASIIAEDDLTNTHALAPVQPVRELDDSEKRNPRTPGPSIEGLGPPTSLSPVHGSMMNEATMSVGNIPQVTVKVELNIITYMVSGPSLPRMPSVPRPVFQVVPSVQTSSPPPVSGSATMTGTTQPMQSSAVNSFISASSNVFGGFQPLC
ncbi:hypothetical protein Nepgr_001653 [Nepenthes gracilis]|uniref:Uncharacterized protein n=1 Tax=Nepenthes gracilis TaxID=150966 RepID=A0AAD3P8K6_NEPGR|nr:hypothetical protein Nepgr_001653 [Nepenthes gracilis]